MECDYESSVWDDNEFHHGEIDTEYNRKDAPDGFVWTISTVVNR